MKKIGTDGPMNFCIPTNGCQFNQLCDRNQRKFVSGANQPDDNILALAGALRSVCTHVCGVHVCVGGLTFFTGISFSEEIDPGLQITP